MDIMEEKLPIGPEEVAEAAAVLQKYKAGKVLQDLNLSVIASRCQLP